MFNPRWNRGNFAIEVVLSHIYIKPTFANTFVNNPLGNLNHTLVTTVKPMYLLSLIAATGHPKKQLGQD